MAADKRRKDVNWSVADDSGTMWSSIREGVFLAVAMDIRDELQTLNRLLHCHNFTGMPETLRQIRRNTAKPRAKKAKPP